MGHSRLVCRWLGASSRVIVLHLSDILVHQVIKEQKEAIENYTGANIIKLDAKCL